jgi:hypothetical protein
MDTETMQGGPIRHFLPRPRAAVVLTVDGICPGPRDASLEAGGELERGALGDLLWLLDRHPQLRLTLFVSPDGRETSPVPNSPLRPLSWLRDRVFQAPMLPKAGMDLRHYPDFVQFLNAMPRTEVGLHGLYHSHQAPRIAREFQNHDTATCSAMMQEAIATFEQSGLHFSRGLQPPGRSLPPALRQACAALGVEWVTSGRDLHSRLHPEAVAAAGCGLEGASLVYPQRTAEGLLHFPVNFQASSPAERAFDLLDLGGVLSVKAQVGKRAPGHEQTEGVDRVAMNFLDQLFSRIEDHYGDDIAWTTMGAISDGLRHVTDWTPVARPETEAETEEDLMAVTAFPRRRSAA